eukprot:TRINITY_DN333_c1_g1_i4.p2 TRINITY_DN333_c1_g1~~TRINITY_DN333_c1_g1_i4.p2  ORF type:complete len:254 (-),score=27.16 TRINITY_DN333_c1_g1_i4:277-1038(-)
MVSMICTKFNFIQQTDILNKKVSAARSMSKKYLVVRAEQAQIVSRRNTIGGLSMAILLSQSQASEAAYGDAANVFGSITNKSGFVPYTGEGFAVLLPSKWNPSKEKDFKGVQLRYEDNFDAVTNMSVIVTDSGKKSIKDYGSPEDLLKEIQYLLGMQSYIGETKSEGGFKDNRVSAASILNVSQVNKTNKDYYTYELLVRSADGDEGGRHYLINCAVGSDGQLYILKVQCGDKRWFKGAKREAVGAVESFVVA